MIRLFVSLNLVMMVIIAARARLADPSGCAGSGTGYVTVGSMVISTIILLVLVWSKHNFLRDEQS